MREVAQLDAALVRTPAGDHADKAGAADIFAALRAFPKPPIAAVDGHCLACGMEIATLCGCS